MFFMGSIIYESLAVLDREIKSSCELILFLVLTATMGCRALVGPEKHLLDVRLHNGCRVASRDLGRMEAEEQTRPSMEWNSPLRLSYYC